MRLAGFLKSTSILPILTLVLLDAALVLILISMLLLGAGSIPQILTTAYAFNEDQFAGDEETAM